MEQGAAGFSGQFSSVDSKPNPVKNHQHTYRRLAAFTEPMVCEEKFQQLRDVIKSSDLKMLLNVVEEVLVREQGILEEAVSARDVGVAKNALHKMKGLCGNYGLNVLADEAKGLEDVLCNDADDIVEIETCVMASYVSKSVAELKVVQATL